MRLLVPAAVALASAWAAVIPAGTNIQIRLTTGISSTTGKAGDPFAAVVIEPVIADGRIAMAQHVAVTGKIATITPAKTDGDPIVLTPEFTSVHDDQGHAARLAAKLTAIDNAREKVNEQGQIVGIVPKNTLSSRLDQGIGKLQEQYSQLASILGAAKGALLKKTDPNIVYAPGAEMTIRLTKPLVWNGLATEPPIGDIQPADQLSALVNAEPFRTVTVRTSVPSDITNLMFIGSREQLEQAFRDAGWSAATSLNEESKFKTFQALAEMNGYQEAPVSILLLNGFPPDLVFEKLNDTFAARHHLRIWHMPQRFNGMDVWVCSSTHDTGISFSEDQRTFIHRIDSEIDHERAKVVSDLVFTGEVRGLALVDRESVPHSTVNGTGDRIDTDGKMAVVAF